MSTNTEMATISILQLVLSRAFDFLKLTKPKLTSLVLFTTLIGFYIAVREPLPLLLLIHTLVGTALVAGGAAAFNMYKERNLDARMNRTALRPLATGRLSSKQALLFALGISGGGYLYLFAFVNPLTSMLSAVIFAGYVFLYTPLKAKSWISTFVGAFPGALPPIMGWTAANATISYGACVLFLIVFFWQIPHFFAIAWLHRADYANAGIPVIPALDRDGRKSSRISLLFIAGLIVLSLFPFFMDIAGGAYLSGAVLLGLAFLGFGLHFARLRNETTGRRLFAASAFYLPSLLILLALDKTAS
jgi:protoheme IX farnesyltransferase